MISTTSLLLFWLTKLEVFRKVVPSIVTLFLVLLLQGFELQIFASEPNQTLGLNNFLIPFITLVFGAACIYFKKPLTEVAFPLLFGSFTVKFGGYVNLYTLMFLFWISMIASRPIRGRLEKLERYLLPVILLFINLIFNFHLVNTSTLQNLPYFSNNLDSQVLLGILIFTVLFILINEAVRNLEAFLKRGEIFSLASLIPIVLLFSIFKKELTYTDLKIDVLFLIISTVLLIFKSDSLKNRMVVISLLVLLSFFPNKSIWILPLALFFHPILSGYLSSKRVFLQALPTTSLIFGVLAMAIMLIGNFDIFKILILILWVISLIEATGFSFNRSVKA